MEAFDKAWKKLKPVIAHMYGHGNSNVLWENFRGVVRDVIKRKDGDKLIAEIQSTITLHLEQRVEEFESTPGSFIKKLLRLHTDHNKALELISSMVNSEEIALLLNLWRDKVIYSTPVRNGLGSAVGTMIERDQCDERLLEMLKEEGDSVFAEFFLRPFEDLSTNIYKRRSKQLLKKCQVERLGCGKYLEEVAGLQKEEIKRRERYMLLCQGAYEMSYFIKEMIGNHLHLLLPSLASFLTDQRVEDISRMYNLFAPVAGALKMMRDVVIANFSGQFRSPPSEEEFVPFMLKRLTEKERWDSIIESGFGNDKILWIALNNSFKKLLNMNPRATELVSLFLDGKLRKGLDEGDETFLDMVIRLLHYVEEKDLFEIYYRHHLARRLLSGKRMTGGLVSEMSFIVKMKVEFGDKFISKLESMMTDMQVSEDAMKDFNATYSGELSDCPSMAVSVLSPDAWPIQRTERCILPAELSGQLEKFESHYPKNKPGRKLSLQTHLGTAKINALCGNGRKHELFVSTHEMCVLMLFNKVDKLSYKEIEAATKIPAASLITCLRSLAREDENGILMKDPINKDIREEDTFSFSDGFKSNLYKVKFRTAIPLEEVTFRPVRQMVEVDRKPQIEAAIVREMKARKMLKYESLFEVLSLQFQFPVDSEEMKKIVTSLVERDYIEWEGDSIKYLS